jgi:hypothetical protein
MAFHPAVIIERIRSIGKVYTMKPDIFPLFFRVPFKYQVYHNVKTTKSKITASFFPCIVAIFFAHESYFAIFGGMWQGEIGVFGWGANWHCFSQ